MTKYIESSKLSAFLAANEVEIGAPGPTPPPTPPTPPTPPVPPAPGEFTPQVKKAHVITEHTSYGWSIFDIQHINETYILLDPAVIKTTLQEIFPVRVERNDNSTIPNINADIIVLSSTDNKIDEFLTVQGGTDGWAFTVKRFTAAKQAAGVKLLIRIIGNGVLKISAKCNG